MALPLWGSRGADRLLNGALHGAGAHRCVVAGPRFRHRGYVLYRRSLCAGSIRDWPRGILQVRAGESFRRAPLRSTYHITGCIRSFSALGGVRNHTRGNARLHPPKPVCVLRSAAVDPGSGYHLVGVSPSSAIAFGATASTTVGELYPDSGRARNSASAGLPRPHAARLAFHPWGRSVLPRRDDEPDDDQRGDRVIPDLPTRLSHADGACLSLERARPAGDFSGAVSCANRSTRAGVLRSGPPPVGPGLRGGGRLLFRRSPGRSLRELCRSTLSQPRSRGLLDCPGSVGSYQSLRLARCPVRPHVCHPRFIRRLLSSGGELILGAIACARRRAALAVLIRRSQEAGGLAHDLALALGIALGSLCLVHLRPATSALGPRRRLGYRRRG